VARRRMRKTKAERKQDVLRLRLTAEQKRAIVDAANRETLDFSSWARRVLLREAGWAPRG
jgi:uncharacterized protein (DUF1778 family)